MKALDDWWYARKDELIALAGKECPLYVFNEETYNEVFFDLLSIDAIDNLFFPLNAAFHPEIIRKAYELDMGFKCISSDELDELLEAFPKLNPQRILFFPDNVNADNLKHVFNQGTHVVVNEQYFLKAGSGSFQNRTFFISGNWVNGQRINELHKRSVNGFYIQPKTNLASSFDPTEMISFLDKASWHFPEASMLILGNNVCESELCENSILNIQRLGCCLETIKDAYPQFQLWLELPVFMVSCAGVLLAKILETGEAEGIRYIKMNIDMKAYDHDGLFGACHQIINLSKPNDGETIMMIKIFGQDKGSGNMILVTNAPASVVAGDILLFMKMGAYGPGIGAGNIRASPVPAYFLSARRLCSVKI